MNNQISRTGRMFFPALVTGLVVLAAPAWGQVIDEDVKLLPSDGAASDWFGNSVAIVINPIRTFRIGRINFVIICR